MDFSIYYAGTPIDHFPAETAQAAQARADISYSRPVVALRIGASAEEISTARARSVRLAQNANVSAPLHVPEGEAPTLEQANALLVAENARLRDDLTDARRGQEQAAEALRLAEEHLAATTSAHDKLMGSLQWSGAVRDQLVAALQAEQEWREREADGALDPEWNYDTMVAAKRRDAITTAGAA